MTSIVFHNYQEDNSTSSDQRLSPKKTVKYDMASELTDRFVSPQRFIDGETVISVPEKRESGIH